jgi:hypothetical protein
MKLELAKDGSKVLFDSFTLTSTRKQNPHTVTLRVVLTTLLVALVPHHVRWGV